MERRSYQTLEFWLSVAAMIFGAWLSSGLLDATSTDVDNKIIGAIVTVLAALGYGTVRTVQKINAAKKDVFMKAADEKKLSGPGGA